MELQPREYQQRSLDSLEEYLGLVAQHGARTAFVLQTQRPYRSVPQLPALPYVCLRVPTGGGKTLMACHALGIVARSYLQVDTAVCLWLVPSNTIRDQTLAALRNLEHPYRQAVNARFAGQVHVMDLSEALYVQRNTLEGETCIIVSTLAALRVEDTEGRKVYEPAGALSHHFSGLTANLEALLEKREDGTIPHSLANVLRLWRPVVIMDEAHNARTQLSFDTLARFNPSCVIEFTATPETEHNPERERFASNVLHHVSAAELKAEEMVKLPIKLQTRSEWKEVIGSAVFQQKSLETIARQEERGTREYIRPIVLFQAQPRSQERHTITVDVVKQCLMEDFKVPEEEIAVATGQTREIDEIDLFDRGCPIRFIITVAALKEGWDCSFAYILCSVADIGSTRAVEQILGRVLRLPQARRKNHAELNCAYAFAASEKFIEAAESLKDALVENGFQRIEVGDLVASYDDEWLFGAGRLVPRASQRVSEVPNLSGLNPAISDRVTYYENTGELTVTGVLNEQEMVAIRSCFSKIENRQAVERIFETLQGRTPSAAPAPADREPIRVPVLAIRVDNQLELFDESHFLNMEWNLAECDASLSEAEFPSQYVAGLSAEVDVNEAGRVEIHFVEQVQEQLATLIAESGWTVAALANWLDRQILHPEIPQTQSSLFIHRLLTSLMESRGLTIEQLARQKFRMRNAVESKINIHRQTQRRKAYNLLLFESGRGSIEVSPELCFGYSADRYAPNWYCEGSYRFRKHYFSTVGELKADGEEYECAVSLDQLPAVKYWVRNLERRPESSFWLQTATDRFYPDFVALLNDGRILVVESKGEVYWTNDDSKEKRAVGELWAERSGGRCLFIMPRGTDWSAITNCIRK